MLFSGDYQTEAKSQSIVIGEYLTHQLDPNRSCRNFPSRYLVDLDSKKKKDSSSGMKQGHEMHGVLLTLLFYMLLMESAKKLDGSL